jgi:antitoxin component YwqK of YwqJK toxin-antitoxin module
MRFVNREKGRKMKSFATKYGSLTGIVAAEYYPEGALRECTLNSANKLSTPWGELVPQYSDGGSRRKHTKSLSFYPNGDLKSVALHDQTAVTTPAGVIPAELLTFYAGEKLCRIFPLNGQLTGFWSEADEYGLAEEVVLRLPVAELKQKIISIHFYESGAIQSVTLWPRDSLIVRAPIGNLRARTGFSLYPDGRLQSVEPLTPTPVKTPIGEIMAYDLNTVGISADNNSLRFTPAGEVESVVTSSDRIILTAPDGSERCHEPELAPSLCDEEKLEPVPMRIEFAAGERVIFDQQATYEWRRFDIAIESRPLRIERSCDQCSGYEECPAAKHAGK